MTGAAVLGAVGLHSDRLDVAADGMMLADGHRADDLLDRFGSPLNVVLDATLRAGRSLPRLHPGDAVAVLDCGMYAEALANQFNAVGRPATAMVSGTQAHLVRRGESVADIFALHVVPPHLQPAGLAPSRKAS